MGAEVRRLRASAEDVVYSVLEAGQLPSSLKNDVILMFDGRTQEARVQTKD